MESTKSVNGTNVISATSLVISMELKNGSRILITDLRECFGNKDAPSDVSLAAKVNLIMSLKIRTAVIRIAILNNLNRYLTGESPLEVVAEVTNDCSVSILPE